MNTSDVASTSWSPALTGDQARARILVLTDRVPRLDHGHGIRVANTIAGLKSIGDVHVCLIDHSRLGEGPVGDQPTSMVRAHPPSLLGKQLRWLRLLPANIRYRKQGPLRSRLRDAIGTTTWDLVWCCRARAHVQSDRLYRAHRRIVDLDDLADDVLISRLRERRRRHGRWRTLPRDARDWLDSRLWRRLQRRIAAAVDSVVVCTSADCTRLGVTNCRVVPNGYALPRSHRDPDAAHRGRQILFVGPLTYEPNLLAVEWFIEAVLPLIRVECSDAQFVVLGDRTDVTVRGTARDGVVMEGHVADVTPYYDRAAIAVTPLRSGGGTRVKVIEALAFRVPLVSTPFGCLGHRLEAGTHLLVADTAEEFARHCLALLGDKALSDRVATAGFSFYETQLTAAACSNAVAALAAATLNRPASSR